jgi:hypothetical protein
MTPEGSSTPFQRHQGYEMGARPDDGRPQVLTIRFVRAEDGGVTGALDPYWDPDRGSQATTIFRGRLIDDTIEGTFTTRYASGMTDTAGRWRVMRQR